MLNLKAYVDLSMSLKIKADGLLAYVLNIEALKQLGINLKSAKVVGEVQHAV